MVRISGARVRVRVVLSVSSSASMFSDAFSGNAACLEHENTFGT